MSGGVGFRLPWAVREAVGLSPSAERMALVHLCAADDASAMWAVTESRIVEADGRDLSEPKVLASCARAELVRAGWEKLPLGLALPHEEAEITARARSCARHSSGHCMQRARRMRSGTSVSAARLLWARCRSSTGRHGWMRNAFGRTSPRLLQRAWGSIG